MSPLKKYSFYTFSLFIFLWMWNYQIINYGFSQLVGQVTILSKAKDINKVLHSPEYPDSLKQKLLFVQEVKRFAIDSLGLNTSKSYETVFDQKGKPVLNIITACKPFELEDYTWSFPLLGEVSYKGFFDTTMLNKEADRLKAKNYDIHIGEVTAWSTLGWFKDPILTNFLKRNDGMLANLIIHELTHGTVYVSSDVYFNENLASFIGHEGAKLFLKQHYGDTSSLYKAYIQEMKNDKIVSDFVVEQANRLDSLYQTFEPNTKHQFKEATKQLFIDEFINKFHKLPLPSIHRYLPANKNINNTYFQSYKRYHSNIEFFENQFKNFKDLPSYIDYIKETYD